MSKASLVIIKSMGIGDLVILIANIHAISKFLNKPVYVLAQKNTHAHAILKNDPHVKEVIELDKKGFFNIIKKIKNNSFSESYIYSDSIRLYFISKFAGIKKIFHYPFFSKKKKNFFKTAKEFTEKELRTTINSQSKIYCNDIDINAAKVKFSITRKTKNIILAPSASGPTKRWDIKNYISLIENIKNNYPCKIFVAGGPKDEFLINEVLNSSIGSQCVSFSKMKISETLPIIAACQYYVGNDTGWGHISAGLNLKSLFLFMDSPPLSYGVYSKNITIIVPDGHSIETCKHNTRGKDKISFDKVLKHALEILN